jgi:hypothetical protein
MIRIGGQLLQVDQMYGHVTVLADPYNTRSSTRLSGLTVKQKPFESGLSISQ